MVVKISRLEWILLWPILMHVKESIATVDAVGCGARGLLSGTSIAYVLRGGIIRIVFRWF